MSFISSAHAATTSASQHGFDIMQFLPMIVIFVLFWLLLIRPQQKKTKLHSDMISGLQKGDEVITNSGILGKINKISEQFITLEIAANTNISVQKSTVATKVEKGTMEKTQSGSV